MMKSCPTPEQLRQFLADKLSAADAELLETHVEKCASCQEALQRLTGDTTHEESPRPESRTKSSRAGSQRQESGAGFLKRLEQMAPTAGGSQSRAADGGTTSSGPRLPEFPGYEVLDRLGHGGMGNVYKAWDLGLKRIVALKTVRNEDAGPEELARFRAEAEAVARMQHPNVVQIYEVGEHEGRLYLALEYIDGGSLAQRLSGKPLAPREAAKLVKELARAIHYAHQRGVIHRDLKPANVLLARDHGRVSGGNSTLRGAGKSTLRGTEAPQLAELAPMVTDFGLAKFTVGGGQAQTRSGAVLGTPSYMPPEQAQGKSALGPVVDVYALGAVLYECLTGRPPFVADTTVNTLYQVIHEEAVPPRQLQPAVPRDLETVCLKCLQKEPKKRYAAAADLADDLHRFLDGQPITARPVGSVERLWRWCVRNPRVAALAAIVPTLLLVMLIGSLGFTLLLAGERNEKENQRKAAVEEKQKAEQAEKQAQDNAQVVKAQNKRAIDILYQVVTEYNQLKQLDAAERDLATVDRDADQAAFDRVRAAIHQHRGDIFYFQQGKTQEAYDQYQQALKVLPNQAQGNDPVDARDLAAVYGRIGRISDHLGRIDEARRSYRRALDLLLAVDRRAPENLEVQRKLAQAYAAFGSLFLNHGNAAAALEPFREALQWQEKVALKTEEKEAARERAATLSELGRAYFFLGDADNATKYHQEALQLRETVRDATRPASYEVLRDVPISLNNLGNVNLRKDRAVAQDYYERALKQRQDLAKANPSSATALGDLAASQYNLATALLLDPQADQKAAASYYQQCLKLRKLLADANPKDLDRQIDLMVVQARCGQHEEAAKTAHTLRQPADATPKALYNAACAYALCSASDKADPDTRRRYADDCLKTLGRAAEQGWKDAVRLEIDPDFDPVLSRPDFQALVKKVRQK